MTAPIENKFEKIYEAAKSRDMAALAKLIAAGACIDEMIKGATMGHHPALVKRLQELKVLKTQACIIARCQQLQNEIEHGVASRLNELNHWYGVLKLAPVSFSLFQLMPQDVLTSSGKRQSRTMGDEIETEAETETDTDTESDSIDEIINMENTKRVKRSRR